MDILPNGPYNLPCLCELGHVILKRIFSNPIKPFESIYFQGIKHTLIAIGYSEEFVNGMFSDYMNNFFNK